MEISVLAIYITMLVCSLMELNHVLEAFALLKNPIIRETLSSWE